MTTRAIVVMGKLPQPGKVKTRLAQGLNEDLAAQLYEAFLLDVFGIVERAISDSGLEISSIFSCAIDDGDRLESAVQLAPDNWRVIPQRGSDLGERIAAAREDAKADDVVIIGSDSPTMPHQHLVKAFAALDDAKKRGVDAAVFGPSEDGGYYLIGLPRSHASLLTKIPWSTERVMEETRAAAARSEIQLIELETGYDIDHVEDLSRALVDSEGSALRTHEAIRVALATVVRDV